MCKCLVSLSTVPSVNINATAYDFESIEQAVLFAKNCSAPDSVNVVLDLLDDAGEFVQRLYDYNCKTEASNTYPHIDGVVAEEAPAVIESDLVQESELAQEVVEDPKKPAKK